MIKSRYAILIDGAFLTKKLERRLRTFPTDKDVLTECERIKQHHALRDQELLRIYYYDARPATGTLTNPLNSAVVNLGSTNIYKRSTRLLNGLELQSDFALRLGDTATHGWRIGNSALAQLMQGGKKAIDAKDLVPDVKQKGVDLRIGLDIARLSLRELVRALVIVTGDSDLIPAFSFARREGVRIYLDHLSHGVRRELKVHTDLVL